MNEIDALKEELKQTRLAYQMAVQMSQFKSGFLARTSHELRSPLSSAIGLHQIILSDLCESPEEEREFTRQAYESARKLMQLIDEIVSVAKIDYNLQKLHLEPLQLELILADVYNLTHLQIANRNLRLEIDFPDSSVYVIADRPRLTQILVGLIDGGIDAIEQGAILVTTDSANSDKVVINIDIPCAVDIWQKPAELPQVKVTKEEVKHLSERISFTPAMHLLLAQTAIAAMKGSLHLHEIPATDVANPSSRLQLICPKAN